MHTYKKKRGMHYRSVSRESSAIHWLLCLLCLLAVCRLQSGSVLTVAFGVDWGPVRPCVHCKFKGDDQYISSTYL